MAMRQLKIADRVTVRSNSIKSYFLDIAQYSVMSASEEADLTNAMVNGSTPSIRERAFGELIQRNLRFVVSVAKQYSGRGVELDDLIQEGNVGLIIAARQFDPTKGFKFISYAVWWVRQSILKFLSDNASLIRMPLNKVSVLNKIYSATTKFLLLNGREPSVGELEDLIGGDLSADDIAKALSEAECQKNSSLDAPLSDDSDSSISDLTPADVDAPDRRLDDESLSKQISLVLDQLTDRESFTIRAFYGLGRFKGQTLSIEEIGDSLGLTRERARQIKQTAVTKLRNKYGDQLKQFLASR